MNLFNLATQSAIFTPGLEAKTKALSPTFYPELETEFNGFAGHVLISQHHFAEDWPTWEVHPAGDEFVTLITGDITSGALAGSTRMVPAPEHPKRLCDYPQGRVAYRARACAHHHAVCDAGGRHQECRRAGNGLNGSGCFNPRPIDPANSCDLFEGVCATGFSAGLIPAVR